MLVGALYEHFFCKPQLKMTNEEHNTLEDDGTTTREQDPASEWIFDKVQQMVKINKTKWNEFKNNEEVR